MTKLFSIVALAALTATFVACGPSAEEKAKMEEAAKRTADSISAALTESLNSAMETATTDSTAAAATTETAAAPATTEPAKH